jgi:hypothetical protein
MEQPKIIASREASSMASVWTEYLCLMAGDTKRFKVFTGGYEGLDEASKYYVEETEEYVLPETIDGKIVVGVDVDGVCVIGGELTYYGIDDDVEFDNLDELELANWLHAQRWSKYLSAIADAIIS